MMVLWQMFAGSKLGRGAMWIFGGASLLAGFVFYDRRRTRKIDRLQEYQTTRKEIDNAPTYTDVDAARAALARRLQSRAR